MLPRSIEMWPSPLSLTVVHNIQSSNDKYPLLRIELAGDTSPGNSPEMYQAGDTPVGPLGPERIKRGYTRGHLRVLNVSNHNGDTPVGPLGLILYQTCSLRGGQSFI